MDWVCTSCKSKNSKDEVSCGMCLKGKTNNDVSYHAEKYVHSLIKKGVLSPPVSPISETGAIRCFSMDDLPPLMVRSRFESDYIQREKERVKAEYLERETPKGYNRKDAYDKELDRLNEDLETVDRVFKKYKKFPLEYSQNLRKERIRIYAMIMYLEENPNITFAKMRYLYNIRERSAQIIFQKEYEKRSSYMNENQLQRWVNIRTKF